MPPAPISPPKALHCSTARSTARGAAGPPPSPVRRAMCGKSPRNSGLGRAAREPFRSVEFLRESDEQPSGPADVAEPVHILVADDFAHELGAALQDPCQRLVEVVHGEHDAEVAQ